MSVYKAPLRDILFATTQLGGLSEITQLSENKDFNEDLFYSILQQASKVGEKVLAPLNRKGDVEGAKCQNGEVTTVPGWKEAYKQFVEDGWNGLVFDTQSGGQGLPWLVATAVQEIWHGANMAFSLCTLLTQAAIESITLHGSEEQKATYLEPLIAGTWSGTMNLTEPQAGSDLSAVKTTATQNGGHYLLKGQKIFVTYGDHDLTENIIHLVLARIPNGPKGTKGISLFIVPKFLPDENSDWTIRNDIETLSIEHKLGIHGSPTAVLSYGNKKGAIGYLVGEENQGMMYMFTMMNIARLAVGVQANGVAEAAYQQAVWFANQRTQGTPIDKPTSDRVAIIAHADVKRMLMVQKCRIESIRSLSLVLAAAFDKTLVHPEKSQRELNQALVDIFTPVVKGYGTEMALENVSLALQVHGGMGFIEETGIAQYYRDQRITTIYEGTTGIQALDLVNRKLLRDKGKIAQTVIAFVEQDITANSDSAFTEYYQQLGGNIQILKQAMELILQMGKQDVIQPSAVCEPYLRLWGTILCAWQLFKAACVAKQFFEQTADRFYKNKITMARFYFSYEMPKAVYYHDIIKNGSAKQIAKTNDHLFETLQ